MNQYSIFKKLHCVLTPLFNEAVANRVFPGAVLAVTVGRKDINQSMVQPFGKHTYNGSPVDNNTLYDLASLTKTVTALAIFSLIKDRKIELDQTLADLLEQKIPPDKKNITLHQLLNHSSGLPAHRPYFKKLISLPLTERPKVLIREIIAEPLADHPGKKQIYSDLGFILLGHIIEKQSGQPIDEYITDKILSPIDIDNLFFNRTKIRQGHYAPTEQCLWRHKLLCGEVHDDNCYAVGGVCGQAGLFGNIWGVMDLVNFIKDFTNKRQEHPNLRQEDLVLAAQPQNPQQGTWGLGLDTPSAKNSSSGQYFSCNSFGHLGFTGTSFWVDLKRDLSVVLLSNRVHPDRDNFRIKKFRPVFHDTVMQIICNSTEIATSHQLMIKDKKTMS